MKNKPAIQEEEDSGSEINTVYGDLITFVAVLFILLFVLAYNEKQEETFFIQMRLQFGARNIEQEKVITSESLLVSTLQGYIEQQKLEDQAQVLVDEQKIKLLLYPPILFDSGKAILKPDGKTVLDGFAKIVSNVRNPIIVEGHTDNVPIHTEDFESNWELSFHRAYAVVRYFIQKHGFSPRQLSGLGYGEYHPLVPNDTLENRSKNRRIEVNIIRITKAAADAGGIGAPASVGAP